MRIDGFGRTAAGVKATFPGLVLGAVIAGCAAGSPAPATQPAHSNAPADAGTTVSETPPAAPVVPRPRDVVALVRSAAPAVLARHADRLTGSPMLGYEILDTLFA